MITKAQPQEKAGPVRLYSVYADPSQPHIPGCWQVLSPTREEKSYSYQTLTFARHSKFRTFSSNQISAAASTSASDEKWRPLNCFISRVGLRTYQHPR